MKPKDSTNSGAGTAGTGSTCGVWGFFAALSFSGLRKYLRCVALSGAAAIHLPRAEPAASVNFLHCLIQRPPEIFAIYHLFKCRCYSPVVGSICGVRHFFMLRPCCCRSAACRGMLLRPALSAPRPAYRTSARFRPAAAGSVCEKDAFPCKLPKFAIAKQWVRMLYFTTLKSRVYFDILLFILGG